MTVHRETYMSLVGAFLWLANMTSFELGYISCQLTRFVSYPARVHFQAALRVIVFLRGSKDCVLTFSPSTSRPILRALW